ncbi:MAG TPA: ElyC/SanA/YdcF family protein [Fibrobacteraceae bacterium]|nr:ElyC/SanA/YdcF family protein [Fibrobacteraceae bacterium]
MSRIFANLNQIRDTQRRRRFHIGVILGVLFLILLLFVYLFIGRSGYWLVDDDSFEHVSWVAILDGQTADMERSDYTLKIMEEGKADSVLILGRRVFRDKNNADYYADDFMRSGNIDSGRVFLFRHNDPSTLEEALSIVPWFKSKNVDTDLLITSAAASNRAKHIFTTLAGEKPVFITVDIQHYLYNSKNWFFERESRKIWLREWFALFNSYYDLWGVDTLELDSLKLPEVKSLKEERISLPKVESTKWISIKETFLKNHVSDSILKVDSAKTDSTKKDSTKIKSAKKDSTSR